MADLIITAQYGDTEFVITRPFKTLGGFVATQRRLAYRWHINPNNNPANDEHGRAVIERMNDDVRAEAEKYRALAEAESPIGWKVVEL